MKQYVKVLVSSLLICLAVLPAGLVKAQELNCKVSIRHDKILNVDPQVFVDMERAISTFINTRKWTTDEFTNTEKIDCTIMFNLTSKLDANSSTGYGATINIQATRPVFNTGYNTSLINYVDREVNFQYNQFSPLTFEDNRVTGIDPLTDNLTATLAYYVYLILGLDYDSFSLNGGTLYFKKAQNIVNNAPEGKGVSGWKAVESTKNRYWITDQILNPRFSELRKYWYTMHRQGFDLMYDRPNEARKNIFSGVAGLQKLNRENPNAILVQFFFNAKSTEFINLLTDMPAADRQQYITLLSQADVTNANKYQNIK